MPLIRLIIWVFAAAIIAWIFLPLIGAGILFFLGLLAVLFIISFISKLLTGRSGFGFHTFTVRTSPGEKAEAARAEQDEIFDAEFGEDAGEVVELPPTALHKE